MPKNSSVFEELCEHYPVRIAHRGASEEAPENTLPAIRLAITKYRVDLVEADLQSSREGVPVVCHDDTLERTTNGMGRVSQYPLSELKTLDAAYFFDPSGKGEFPYRGKGVTIPTLEEVLREFPEVRFCLEIKEKSPEAAKRVVEIVRRLPRTAPLVIGSFHAEVTKALRPFASEFIKIAFSRRDVLWAYLAFRFRWKRYTPPARYAAIPTTGFRGRVRLDDPPWIEFLHGKGVRVFYWTIDDPAEMKALLQKGADGILSNDPAKFSFG